jgi:geranylgeranyl pyrophosphate synthase
LQQILGDRELRVQCIEEVSSLIRKYGGFKKARKKALDAVEKSFEVLTIFTEKSVMYERNVLEGLAHYVVTREK